MNKRNFMFKEVFSDDPAGQVVEDELRSLTSIDDPSGGSAMSCVVVGTVVAGVIAASIALCPTTVCTSHCQPELPKES